MTAVGAYEAKTHLAELLERVEKGERFTITKRGKPVAMLIPAEPASADVGRVVQEMLCCRDTDGPTLGKALSIRQLVEQGRRN
jgi:prevent-host-death family protein